MPFLGTDTFPAEVWLVIFKHARLPIPAPLSRPPRSALRQQTLTAIARTCTLFHQLSMPLLYGVIATDHFTSLFKLYRKTQKASRPNLLAYCHTLLIEYHDETEFGVSYRNLIKEGGTTWDRVAPSDHIAREMQMEDCDFEFQEQFLAVIPTVARTGLRNILPRLETICVGSIYGHQGTFWSRYTAYELDQQANDDEDSEAEALPTSSLVQEYRDMWNCFLADSGVKHLCIRDPTAPFGLPSRREEPGGTRPQTTLHFDGTTPGPTLHTGRNATWVSDVPQDQAWTPVFAAIRQAASDALMARVQGYGARHFVPLQVDIYGSTGRLGEPTPGDHEPIHNYVRAILGAIVEPIPVDAQRVIAKELGDRCSVRAEADSPIRPRDEVRG